MKTIFYIILTVVFAIVTFNSGIMTIRILFHLHILASLIQALITYVAYIITVKCAKKI